MKRATLALVAAFAAIVATAETSRTATENWTRNRIAEATNGLRRVDDLNVYTNADVWTHGPLPDGLSLSASAPYYDHAFGGYLWNCIDEGVSTQAECTMDIGYGEVAEFISEYSYRAFTATRTRYSLPGNDLLATSNGVDAAIAVHHDDTKQDKITASGILIGDGSGGVTAATPSSTGGADADYRDPKDNTCHKTEFTEWVCTPVLPSGATIEFIEDGWHIVGDGISSKRLFHPEDEKTLTWESSDWSIEGGSSYDITATRQRVATKDETFVTTYYVTNEVATAISTNNPAFVSAVRDTPTSGMPEDMPTDWGTYGTVGAALAALAAGLKWCKNILGTLASGYSTFAEWIASKYTRPTDGIPKTDLASDVQTSLGKANNAIEKPNASNVVATVGDGNSLTFRNTLSDAGAAKEVVIEGGDTPESGVSLKVGGSDVATEAMLVPKANRTAFADAYVATQSYAVGDVVDYNGVFYQCVSATSGGAWDATKWEARKLSDFFRESASFTPPTTVAGALKNSILEKSIVLAVTENFADADTTSYGGQN